MEQLRRTVAEINKDLHSLESAVVGLRVETKVLHEDLIELRTTNKVLLEFMYKLQGAKAQLVALFSFLVGLSTISNIFIYLYFKH